MFQAASATSRVQAKNCIITQGIEIMSLMCKAYESVTTPTQCAKKVIGGVQTEAVNTQAWRYGAARGSLGPSLSLTVPQDPLSECIWYCCSR